MDDNTEQHVVCIGGGVIGSGWAARFALAGMAVTVYDPSDAARAQVVNCLNAARRVWDAMSLSPPPPEGAVQVISDSAQLPAALAQATWVQENLPERAELKQQVLAQIEPHLNDKTIIASSTSGLLPSVLQSVLKNPRRFCVAHPFTPVYLLPLVEVCKGDDTSDFTIKKAAHFYRSVGMLPLVLKKELDGFLADRLMEAMWREALWLVHDDMATTAEIDDAIRLGCGLRWAFMGPFLTYRMGGGEGGMRHFMAQFAPALKLPWTKLTDVPEMDDALINKIVAQTDWQAQGKSNAELIQWRDDCLAAVLQATAPFNKAVGLALSRTEKRRYSTAHAAAAKMADLADAADSGNIPAPLSLYTARVLPSWIDYNGHTNESRYLQMFGDASDALLNALGVTQDYVTSGRSYYTVETHLHHLAETKLNDKLAVSTQVLAADEKRLHVFHTMRRGEVTVASAEQLLLHVEEGRAAAALPAVQKRALAFAAAHAVLPLPPAAGKVGKPLGKGSIGGKH